MINILTRVIVAVLMILAAAGIAPAEESELLKKLLPEAQHTAAEFILLNMPEHDKQALTPGFLAEHIEYAFKARNTFPWSAQVPEEIFLNYILPYSSLDESRDAWRKPLFEKIGKMVANCKSAGEAAIKLNTGIYSELNVQYSRERSKPCMSALEVMKEGKASCTGLSILLVSACRAVGIPARLVGTPVWVEGGGNHTWVEIWDDGWHSIGASESKALNSTWFAQRASKQIADNPRHAIYAASFAKTGTHFPLVWAPLNKSVHAVNVTSNYAIKESATASLDALKTKLAEQKLADLLEKLKKDDVLIRKDDLTRVTELAWNQYVQEITADSKRQAEQESKSISFDGLTMRYAYDVVGERPENGYSLYIAMHGGGGAPAQVNDSQWEHMKVYYRNGVTNGIYMAPRGVNNEWNLHWRDQSFACYDRIIENMVAFGQVDPNRVYIMGFSAGGDAAYQLPARMPDRWAGAAMSAGHPNGVPPDNYANLGFLLQVGERDSAYKRNQVGGEYGVMLASLQKDHPGLYKHATRIHAGQGHNFMDRGPAGSTQRVFADAAAWLEKGKDAPTEQLDCHSIRWLDQHVRNPLPKKIIWDCSTSANRSGEKEPGFWPTTDKSNLHYWIGTDRYDKDTELKAGRIVVEFDAAQRLIKVSEIGNFVRFYLHPGMFEPGTEVRVMVEGKEIKATPKLSLRILVQTILDRGDPNFIFPSCLTLHLNPEGNWMLE